MSILEKTKAKVIGFLTLFLRFLRSPHPPHVFNDSWMTVLAYLLSRTSLRFPVILRSFLMHFLSSAIKNMNFILLLLELSTLTTSQSVRLFPTLLYLSSLNTQRVRN